jgi:hypothetical protein
MPHTFKRPENLSFPQIYYSFKAKDRDFNEIVDYHVQDLPEEYFERAIDLMVTEFLPDEIMCTAQNIKCEFMNDPNAIEEFRAIYAEFVQKKLALACFQTGGDELVAVNFTVVSSIDDFKDEHKVISCLLQIVCKYSQYQFFTF